MENKIDKVFREKLENHSILPTNTAWVRIKSKGIITHHIIQEKRTIRTAWRLAAAIAGLGCIGWFGIDMLQQNTKPSNQVQQKAVEPHKSKAIDQPAIAKAEDQKIPTSSAPIKKTRKTAASTQTVAIKANKVEQQAELIPLQTQVEVIISVEEGIERQPMVELPIGLIEPKPMVIVYSLPPVESKLEAEEKSTGFQRVIQFAQDVKGGETTLASVRLWKNNPFGFEVQENNKLKNN